MKTWTKYENKVENAKRDTCSFDKQNRNSSMTYSCFRTAEEQMKTKTKINRNADKEIAKENIEEKNKL